MGRVVFYDPKANYGFIDPNDGGADVIFSIRPYDDKVAVDDFVYFELAPAPQVTTMGRQALRVWRAVGTRPEPEVEVEVIEPEPEPEVIA
jgi:hypothetical protein